MMMTKATTTMMELSIQSQTIVFAVGVVEALHEEEEKKKEHALKEVERGLNESI